MVAAIKLPTSLRFTANCAFSAGHPYPGTATRPATALLHAKYRDFAMPILMPFLKLAYYPIPKVACTSLKHVIMINNEIDYKEVNFANKKQPGADRPETQQVARFTRSTDRDLRSRRMKRLATTGRSQWCA